MERRTKEFPKVPTTLATLSTVHKMTACGNPSMVGMLVEKPVLKFSKSDEFVMFNIYPSDSRSKKEKKMCD